MNSLVLEAANTTLDLKGESLLLKNFYPSVQKAFSSITNRNKMLRYIFTYIDKNSEVLSKSGLYDQLYFKETDKNIPLLYIDYKMDDLLTIIKNMKEVDYKWEVLGEPKFWVYTAILRYFHVEVKKRQEFEIVLLYLVLYFYSSLFYKFFRFSPNANIMDFTISNLSNRFYIKKYLTLQKTLLITATNFHESNIKKLERGRDVDFKDYILGLRTAINSFVLNIKNEYEKNKAAGKYINKEQDIDEEGDDGKFVEIDNISFQIEKIANNANMYIVMINIDKEIVKLVATLVVFSESIISTAIHDIIGKKGNQIKELLKLVLAVYLEDSHNTVDTIISKKFIAHCLKSYTSSNTTNNFVIKIKDILDDWLVECSPKYSMTQRAATKGEFKKALFLYFVFAIQKSYKFKG